MLSTVVNNKKNGNNWKIYPCNFWGGRKDGIGALKTAELPGDSILMECLRGKWFHLQSKQWKKDFQFGNFILEFRTKHIKWLNTLVWLALVMMYQWWDWDGLSGIQELNLSLSLALGQRLRRAIHAWALCSKVRLAMVGADTSSATVAYLFKRNSIYIIDEGCFTTIPFTLWIYIVDVRKSSQYSKSLVLRR